MQKNNSKIIPLLFLLVAMFLPLSVLAENGLPMINAVPAAGGGQNYSLSLQTLILLTSLTFIPVSYTHLDVYKRQT